LEKQAQADFEFPEEIVRPAPKQPDRDGATQSVKVSLGPDPFLLTVVVLILTIGIVMVTSASYIIAVGKYGDGFYFAKKQGLAMVVGLGVMCLFSLINPNFWKKAALPLMATGLVLLLLVFIPGVGVKLGGSSRWIKLPFGFFLQPSELIKYALIMFIAGSLAKKGDGIKEFTIGFLPHVLVMGVVVFFIFMEPDFGTAVILTTIGFLMLFVAGVKLRHLFGGFILALPLLVHVAISAPYRFNRIMMFINPWSDPLNAGWHMIQSLVAFACGGAWGVGIGQSISKLFYLPQPHTDFIFSVVGEELGLAGVILLIVLFYILVCRGLTVAIRTTDKFQKYLAFGITSLIGLQAMVNMAVSMGMLPTKGLPLPLISVGGTSLVMNLAGLGILMAITKATQMAAREKRP